MVIWLFLHQLWCHVQRRSLDRSQHHCVTGHGTCKTKVAEFDNPIRSNQDVLRLHVTMNDAIGVEVMQSSHKLFCNALHSCFWQTLIILKNLKQFT